MKRETHNPKPETRSRLRLSSGFVRASAALTLCIASTAAALTPAVLVDSNLEPQYVTVTGLHGDRLIYFDAQRRLRNESVTQFVQLRDLGGAPGIPGSPPAPGNTPGHSGWIELTDGQRVAGRLEIAPDAEAASDAVYWHTPALGTIRIPLDRITRIRLASDDVAPDLAAPGADAVALTNGDVIAGFIVGVNASAVEITPEGASDGSAALTLPLDRVVELRLANPPDYPDRVDPRERLVTLRSGSRVRVIDLDLAAQRVTFDLPLAVRPAEPRTLPVEQVARIDFTGSGWRLVDLADRPLSVTGGGDVLGLPMPPRVEGGDVLMHAPVRVTFDVPPGAQRLAADARLDLGEPPEGPAPRAAAWADFEIIVESGSANDHRYRLSAEHPAAAINVPLGEGPLTIELDPGINGPILDRLRLHNAALLVRTEVQPVSDSAGGE